MSAPKPRMRFYAGKWYPAERVERMELIDSLQVGDLIRVNGALRIVRETWGPPKRSPRGWRVYGVVFAIRRCSWTRRPTTSVDRFSLYRIPLEIVRRGYGACRTPLGAKLQAEIHATRGTCDFGDLRCCHVAKVIA